MKKRVGWVIIVIAGICLLLTIIGLGKSSVSELPTIASTVLSILSIIVGLLQVQPALFDGFLSRLKLRQLPSFLKKQWGIGPILVLLVLLVSFNTLLVLYKWAPMQPQGTVTSSTGVPTASVAPVGTSLTLTDTSSSQSLLRQPVHINCITCYGPLSIGADLVSVTINSSSSPATTLLGFSFYNTFTQPATGLHFTSIQLLDRTTGDTYQGIDPERWDIAAQQVVPQIVHFQFVIQRGRTYTLSMAVADAQGNAVPYVATDFSL